MDSLYNAPLLLQGTTTEGTTIEGKLLPQECWIPGIALALQCDRTHTQYYVLNLFTSDNPTSEYYIPPSQPPFYSISVYMRNLWLDAGYPTKAAVSALEIKEKRLLHPLSAEGLHLPYESKNILCPEEWRGWKHADAEFREHFLETGDALPYIPGHVCPRPIAEYIQKTLARQTSIWHIYRAELLYTINPSIEITTSGWLSSKDRNQYGYHTYAFTKDKLHCYYYKDNQLVKEMLFSLEDRDKQTHHTPASSVCGSPIPQFILRDPPNGLLDISPVQSPIAQAVGIDEYAYYISSLSEKEFNEEKRKIEAEQEELMHKKQVLLSESTRRHSKYTIDKSTRKDSIDVENIHAC